MIECQPTNMMDPVWKLWKASNIYKASCWPYFMSNCSTSALYTLGMYMYVDHSLACSFESHHVYCESLMCVFCSFYACPI